MRTWGLLSVVLAFSLSAKAGFPTAGLVDGTKTQAVDLQSIVQDVYPGTIIVIGENHGTARDQAQQIQIMQALRAKGLKVAVGMEFLEYPNQDDVEAYRLGQMNEADFLKRVRWGGFSYEFYRQQVLFPNLVEDAHTIALNIPREVTSQIAKGGLASLSAEQRALMPSNFAVGRDSYRERFLQNMPHLPNLAAGENYFTAQSTWDDTMAWKATRYMEAHPDQVLVVVIGEFHVQYGGGFPDRLRARGASQIITFSQVETEGMTDQEREEAIKPSGVYGPRADYIWF